MKFRFAALPALGLALCFAAVGQDAPSPVSPSQDNSGSQPPGQPQAPGAEAPQAGHPMGRGAGRGWGGGFVGGGRGVMGTVTEAGPDHYTIKTQTGETYTVHFSANTRVIKQPAQRMNQSGNPGGNQGSEMRTPPQEIKSSDVKVGDVIAAAGEVDPGAKSVGAMTVIKLDPEHAREMREMQANFGKTWLVGKVTEIKDTKITLQSPVDNAPHTIVADENTLFRKRREPITLADVQVGDNIRVEGAVKEGVFVASAVTAMGPPVTGGPVPRPGPPPQ